jgi:hypothetical protein
MIGSALADDTKKGHHPLRMMARARLQQRLKNGVKSGARTNRPGGVPV